MVCDIEWVSEREKDRVNEWVSERDDDDGLIKYLTFIYLLCRYSKISLNRVCLTVG